MAATGATAIGPSGSTPAPLKQSIAEVAEASRAKWGSGPLQNISLELLGIAPWNRGRLGVSPYHVFDVVVSVREDGLSRQRYREVCVIRVPDSELEAFRNFNREVLAACPDLPPFSSKMRYACLTKHLGQPCLTCDFVSINLCEFRCCLCTVSYTHLTLPTKRIV